MGLKDFEGSKPEKASRKQKRERKTGISSGEITEAINQYDDRADRVEAVREEYITDFHPDFRLEEGWSFERTVTVSCVCGQKFELQGHTQCTNCTREYDETGRAIVMVSRGDNK